jgi:DNA-binding CsgD family transcriptional regulator
VETTPSPDAPTDVGRSPAGVEVVGREDELAALRRFLGRPQGLPAAVVVQGEPGSGKTTVFEAGLRLAVGAGFRILAARPAEAERDLSFTGLRDMLDQSFEELAAGLPAPQLRALGVALLREELPPGERLEVGAVATGLVTALRSLARSGPVLMAVDDAQWLDPASTAAVRFAVRRLEGSPLALLVVERTGRTGRPPALLERTLPEERVVRLPLGPLSVGALSVVLRDRLGLSLARPVLRRLHATSAGNPFFALEIGRALVARGASGEPGEPLPVPDSLHDLVRERIGLLSPRARDLLPTVAALSQPTVEILRALHPDLPVDEALEEAEGKEVLAVRDGQVRFTHPILAASVYGGLAPGARRHLHARLARVAADPEEHARHLALAAAAPHAGVAAVLDEAALRAFTRGAPATAAELVQRARDLTPSGDTASRLRRTVEAGRFSFEAGDTARACALLEEVLAAPCPPDIAADARNQLARIATFTGDLRRAASLYRATLADPGVRVAYHVEAGDGLAWALVQLREDLDEAVRRARSAARTARSLGATDHRAEAMSAQAAARLLLGGGPGAWRTIEEAVRLARPLDALSDPRVVRHPLFSHAVMSSWADRPGASVEMFGALLRRCVERGDEGSMSRILFGLSCGHLLLGDPEAAARYAEEGHLVAEQAGQAPQFGLLLFCRALVQAHLGALEEAVEIAGRDLARARERGADVAEMVNRRALGFAYLTAGDDEAAHRFLGPLVERTHHVGVVEPGAVRFIPDDVEALISLGRLDEAARALDRFEEACRRTRRASGLAAAARCRGLHHAASGDPEAALAALERALRYHARVPIPFERARTLLALGVVQRRARRTGAARASLEEARRIFEAVGAAPWAGRAEREARRTGGRTAAAGLTTTEHRVAELVAEGRSNAEVAAALFVTVKTVEAHLSRIYAKLGVRSRTELAHRVLADASGSEPRGSGASGSET